MNARPSILQRLRAVETSGSENTVEALPAKAIHSDVVAYFKVQAAQSGVDIQHLQGGEKLSDYLAELTHKSSSHCVEATIAIAETGSVAVNSHQNASSDIYLCEHLVVTIAEHNIVHYLHEALDKACHTSARALHVITGPSRTADVEQTIQIGAHGPRSETLIIYRQV